MGLGLSFVYFSKGRVYPIRGGGGWGGAGRMDFISKSFTNFPFYLGCPCPNPKSFQHGFWSLGRGVYIHLKGVEGGGGGL